MTAADRPTEPPVECVAVDRDERCLCPGGPASHRPSPPVPAAEDSLRRGLAQSAAGDTVDLGDFTQYLPAAEDDAVEKAWQDYARANRLSPDTPASSHRGAFQKRYRALLAGSGEQPGPLKAGVMALTGLSSDEVDALGGVREDDRPAPEVPDSAGLREAIESALKAWALDHSGGIEDNETPAWKDATDVVMGVLAVVDQSVTAAQAWDECVQAVAWAMDNGPDPLRYVAEHNPYRAVVRPTGQEQADG